MDGDFLLSAEEIRNLLGDRSFSSSGSSSMNDDDGTGWMQKIDVSTFQRLTSEDFDADLSPRHLFPLYNDVFNDSFRSIKGNGQESPFKKFRRISQSSTSRQKPRKQDISNLCEDDEEEELSLLDELMGIDKQVEIEDQPVKFAPEVKMDIPKTFQTKKDFSGSSDDYAEKGDYETTIKYPKPVYSYSSMIAMALKNSNTGKMHVAEIYAFICDTFPYFRTAASGWKNSVRHNLSLNKSFEKIVVEAEGGHGRKYCLWSLNPEKVQKLNQEIKKSREKHPESVRKGYANPRDLEAVENGLKGVRTFAYSGVRQTTGSTSSKRKLSNEKPSRTAGAPQSVIIEPVREVKKVRVSRCNFGFNSTTVLKRPAAKPEWTAPNRGFNNTRPLILKPIKKEQPASWSSSEDEDEDKPIDFSARSQFQKQLAYLASSTPPRQSGPLSASTPPPASFSTPVRNLSFMHSEPRWSPAFTLTDQKRQFLWPLQNHRTPEKSCESSHDRNGQSLLLGMLDDTNSPYARRYEKFATSWEAAYSASSPHNNSLIVQSSELAGRDLRQDFSSLV